MSRSVIEFPNVSHIATEAAREQKRKTYMHLLGRGTRQISDRGTSQ